VGYIRASVGPGLNWETNGGAVTLVGMGMPEVLQWSRAKILTLHTLCYYQKKRPPPREKRLRGNKKMSVKPENEEPAPMPTLPALRIKTMTSRNLKSKKSDRQP